MGFSKLTLTSVLALGLGVTVASAEGVALVVGNTAYRSFSDATGSSAVLNSVEAFEAAGYTVVKVQNGTEAQMKSALEKFETLHGEADRVVVVLAGHFMNSGEATWFAPVDLASPSLANVGYDALPIAAVLAFLANKPGGAALFLASTESGDMTGALIDKGVGRLHPPQGVLTARGTPAEVATALRTVFLEEGSSLAAAARASPKLAVQGFISDLIGLNGSSEIIVDAPLDLSLSEAMADEAYWRAAEDIGSKASYEAYLRRYPNGEYVALAQERLNVIADAVPKYSPEEQAERTLGLTRGDRRRVQEHLSLLGFDPRGIDGLFGPGSRAAIQRWQSENGLANGGFLDDPSIRQLRAQAERRSEVLADEAQRKKEAVDAADAALWGRTGAHSGEADYRAYLSKFPKGLYADVARTALRDIEESKRDSALAAETEAWDFARGTDTIGAYNTFLDQYPKGSFAEAALMRIHDLGDASRDEEIRRKARADEIGLGIALPMRMLIEGKLASMDLRPGRIDGEFDKSTRRAVRKYQKARGMDVTGYLTRDTVVRLMSE